MANRSALKNRKREIAASAMEALKQLGYANTTLRDIAAKFDLSLGMLHYYFEDKIELITYCVETYKLEFIHDLSASIEQARDRDELVANFSEALVSSIIDDQAIHRLWYDIRTQAIFDPLFRPVVTQIEKSLIGLVDAAVKKAGVDAGGRSDILYAMLDGVFRFVMQSQVTGKAMTRKDMQQLFHDLLEQFL